MIVRVYSIVSLGDIVMKNHMPKIPTAQIAKVTRMSDFLPNFPRSIAPIPAPMKQLQFTRQEI